MNVRRKDRVTAQETQKGFLSRVELPAERIPSFDIYPFCIPAVSMLVDGLTLHPNVTFFVGENGTGKSTLLEGIALAAGFNAEGGTMNFRFSTRSSESGLHRSLRLTKTERRPKTGFFLRAESLFNVATNIEEMDREPAPAPPVIASYGGKSLHEQSHGESFLAVMRYRFGDEGLYVLDEPEAALSPTRQLAFLRRMHDLVEAGSQFVVATHSPIVMAYPNAQLYWMSTEGMRPARFQDVDHFQITKRFLADPGSFLSTVLGDNKPREQAPARPLEEEP
jgi:predicted ATPase